MPRGIGSAIWAEFRMLRTWPCIYIYIYIYIYIIVLHVHVYRTPHPEKDVHSPRDQIEVTKPHHHNLHASSMYSPTMQSNIKLFLILCIANECGGNVMSPEAVASIMA